MIHHITPNYTQIEFWKSFSGFSKITEIYKGWKITNILVTKPKILLTGVRILWSLKLTRDSLNCDNINTRHWSRSCDLKIKLYLLTLFRLDILWKEKMTWKILMTFIIKNLKFHKTTEFNTFDNKLQTHMKELCKFAWITIIITREFSSDRKRPYTISFDIPRILV